MTDLVLIVAALQILVAYLVGVHADCTLGQENPEENEPYESPGLYIDLNNPAPCSGELTRWHYCYYEPEPESRSTTYVVQLGVWRFNRQDNTYRKVGEARVTESVRRRQNDFECDDIRLRDDEYIDIRRGDYLGVIVGTPTLPMATESRGSQLFLATGVTDMDTQSVANNAGSIEELNLHLWAEIVGDPLEETTTPHTIPSTTTTMESPTTQIPLRFTTSENDVETSTTAEVPTTRSKDTTSAVQSSPVSSVGSDINLTDALEREEASGLGVGTIVGITVAALLALMLLLIIIIVTIVCHKKKRSKDTQMSAASKGQAERQGGHKNATIFSGGDALDYETPKPGNGYQKTHSHSTKRQKWQSTRSNRSHAAGESWFNDSFETDSTYNVRYATHAEVSSAAAIYEPAPDAISSNNENGEEDIYEELDSMDLASQLSHVIPPGESAKRSTELYYECPTDAMEYANTSAAHEFNIYDDTL